MLLIAQPKSASTSLSTTIAKMCKLRVVLGVPKKKDSKKCRGFKAIQKLHNNMSERSELFIKQVIKGRRTIFKEHLLPTKKHLEILAKYKDPIVILLRDPYKSNEAYGRAGVKMNEDIIDDLISFHNKYMWWASNKPNVIVIYYKDLILNYKNIVGRICKHFRLKPTKITPLMKKKYTGIGAKEVIEQHESENSGIYQETERIHIESGYKDKEDSDVTDSTT